MDVYVSRMSIRMHATNTWAVSRHLVMVYHRFADYLHLARGASRAVNATIDLWCQRLHRRADRAAGGRAWVAADPGWAQPRRAGGGGRAAWPRIPCVRARRCRHT